MYIWRCYPPIRNRVKNFTRYKAYLHVGVRAVDDVPYKTVALLLNAIVFGCFWMGKCSFTRRQTQNDRFSQTHVGKILPISKVSYLQQEALQWRSHSSTGAPVQPQKIYIDICTTEQLAFGYITVFPNQEKMKLRKRRG